MNEPGAGADPVPQPSLDPRDDAARLLVDERRRTEARLVDLLGDHAAMVEASRDSNADDEHDPEGATIAFERSQVSSLVRQARAHLDEVAAAEHRLRAGTYGRCEECGAQIPPARLTARPVARTCVACAGRARLSRG
ncbi:MAG TPA: TraR/DksA C4-type zinc finger protein [Nocardioidaceae bacterium]|nr:TraR/DksA C4-type zinc finger protein [Nocardioidaceae bacterium]